MLEVYDATIESGEKLLEIKDLSVWYKTYQGFARVVDKVSMYVNKGEKIGLVGESGCGKTTTMRAILRILNPSQSHIPQGEIIYNGMDVLKATKNQILELQRKEFAMVSQEPMAALNPVFTIGEQLSDIVIYSGQFPHYKKKDIYELCVNTISSVLISDPERIMKSYPHQLSGGMRQRICIAMALITPRNLLIADEPGTALDVTIQDQIHRLLRSLVEQTHRSLIMITHSLGVARELVDRIYIMYAGHIVEVAETRKIFSNPSHPYTYGLMECVPRLSGRGISAGIYGYVPDYVHIDDGCRFYSRCPHAMKICKESRPPLTEINNGHYVACFLFNGSCHKEDFRPDGQKVTTCEF